MSSVINLVNLFVTISANQASSGFLELTSEYMPDLIHTRNYIGQIHFIQAF